jgi:hypothetical protein
MQSALNYMVIANENVTATTITIAKNLSIEVAHDFAHTNWKHAVAHVMAITEADMKVSAAPLSPLMTSL